MNADKGKIGFSIELDNSELKSRSMKPRKFSMVLMTQYRCKAELSGISKQ